MPLNYQQTSMLQLLETHLKQLDNEDQILDRKAQQNIGVSTIIVVLVAALNLTQGTPSDLRRIFLALVFLVYAAIFIISYLVLSPKEWWQPFNPTWDEIQRVLLKTEQEYYDWLVANYDDAIQQNKSVTARKATQIQAANLLIGADILLIFLAAAS